MIRFHVASLRRRLLLLVMLSVLPAFVFAAYDAWDRYHREAHVAQDRALELARSVSTEHDDLVGGAHQVLVALAELPPVRWLDAVGCSRLFAQVMAKYVQYSNLGAATPGGEVFCSAVSVRGSVRVADHPWFQEAVRTQRFSVGEFQIGRVTGRPSLLFGLPVIDPAGNVLAVTFASLDLAWFNRLVETARMPQGATLTVLDRNGRILARYPDPERWLGQPMPEAIAQTILGQGEGTAEGPGLDGVMQLYAFTPFGRGGESGTYLSVAIPTAHVFAEVWSRFARHALALGLVAGALLLVAGVGGQIFLLRPIRGLVDATRRLGRGDLAARTGLAREAGELGELARHFDAMADALEQRERDRERAEAAQRESDAQYRSLVESSGDAILLTVPDGKILTANAAACRLFGMTEAEICQAGWGGVVDPADSRLAEGLEERARTGRVTSGLRLRRKDGTTFEGEVSSAVFLDRHGASRTSMIIRDVTERKRMVEDLRSSEGRLRETVETLQRRTRQLEAVRDLTAEITQELDIRVLLQLITQRSVELAGASSGSVYLWEESAGVLVPQTWPGLGDWHRDVRQGLGEGVAGTVAQRREGMIVNDYRDSPYATSLFLERTTITAVMGEPLLYRDRLVGVIVVRHLGPGRPFTEDDRRLIRLFAAQASLAVENARLFAAADQAAREARSLYEVAHSLTTSLDVAALLHIVAGKTVELLGTPHAQVVLWDDATQGLRLGAACGTAAAEVQTQTFRLGSGVNGVVAQTRTPLIVNDYAAFPHRIPGLTGIVAVIGVPLLYRDRFLGVLTSHASTPGFGFTEKHLSLLTSFADQAAVAIENARLYGELRVAAVELEARVRERTQELARANRQLAAASDHKSEFVANMSHELRTPLNSILGFAQLLLEQTVDVLSVKQRRFLSHIHNSGQHLLQLINDILDLSKVEAGKLVLQPEPVAVPKIVDETVAIVRGVADKKGLSIEIAVPNDLPRLMADPVRLKQILFNLLSNAVKFTPEGGRITLSVTRVGAGGPHIEHVVGPGPDPAAPNDASGDWMEIRVADTGVGITPEDMPRLFQDFVQLEATATKRHEGTGLGLALTKRLVELHEGRIWAESEGPGRGACFVVHLPLLDVPAPRILVVDDEAPFRRLLALILGEAGYRVETAQDASEAIGAADTDPPALVVLDIGLPPDGAGGWMALAHFRHTPSLQSVPVLVLTGQDQILAEEALARGASEFLGKPVSPQVLSETVRRLLKRPLPPDTAQDPAREGGA